jgi:glycosyltransferase involved in cell wall biosynthesis
VTRSGAPAPLDAWPLVSIVTPSLNGGRFIEGAIESVRAQDYPRVEHIVVDGGSTDETLAVLARYSPPVRWISDRGTGQSAAINRGFRLASGRILSWLNADDVLHPSAVSAVVERFRGDPARMMVYGTGVFVDHGGQSIEPLRSIEPFHLDRLIEVHNYIVQPATFVRREALETVGYVDETLTWSMDWDLWIRIGRRFPVDFLPRPLATVRLHDDTRTNRAGLAKLRELHRIVRRYSRRRLPPVLVIQGGGNLYRMGRRLLGLPVTSRRPPLVARWGRRATARIFETGGYPWEMPDPGLRRRPPPREPAGAGRAGGLPAGAAPHPRP